MATRLGETRLELTASPDLRVSVSPVSLPRRPPPLTDELLSSWMLRLALANHCAVDELCRYLGLQRGRAPETVAELEGKKRCRVV
ncbi:MAG: hypothetical protein COA78_00780 [Blastopirellula sp.]|nr:MAG: hypothetical protein COA78_00780 [Blastopirellula sp.]